MTRSALSLLLLLCGCGVLREGTPPSPAASPPMTVVAADVAEAKALQIGPVALRQISVSPLGDDALDCQSLTHAKTIQYALWCARAGTHVVIQPGDYVESVALEHGGQQGQPILLMVNGTVRWKGHAGKPVLTIQSAFVQVLGVLLDGDVLIRGSGEGVVISRSAVTGSLKIADVGSAVKNPTVAATVLQFSAVQGILDVSGASVVLRGNVLRSVTVAGTRHVVKDNTIKASAEWNASESLVTGNTLDAPITFGPDADHTVSTRNTYTQSVTVGRVGARAVFGLIFQSDRFAGHFPKIVNGRALVVRGR